MSSKKVAEIVVETLEAAGVRHCYGIVGDTLNHVTDAIHRSQIQWVHVRHEEAAACRGRRVLHQRTPDRLRRLLRTGQPALHQRRLRGPAQPRADGPDRQPDRYPATGHGVSPGGRLQGGLRQLLGVLRAGAQPGTGAPGGGPGLPGGAQPARRGGGDPAGRHQPGHGEGRPAVLGAFPQPVLRPSDAELQDVARLLAHGKKIGIYAGSGCQGAHDLLVALADRLKAPIAHTSRAKDFVEYDNPSTWA